MSYLDNDKHFKKIKSIIIRDIKHFVIYNATARNELSFMLTEGGAVCIFPRNSEKWEVSQVKENGGVRNAQVNTGKWLI